MIDCHEKHTDSVAQLIHRSSTCSAKAFFRRTERSNKLPYDGTVCHTLESNALQNNAKSRE